MIRLQSMLAALTAAAALTFAGCSGENNADTNGNENKSNNEVADMVTVNLSLPAMV